MQLHASGRKEKHLTPRRNRTNERARVGLRVNRHAILTPDRRPKLTQRQELALRSRSGPRDPNHLTTDKPYLNPARQFGVAGCLILFY